MERARSITLGPFCERSINGNSCAKGVDGAPARGVEQLDGRWYCHGHIGAAKAVAAKRRDHGFGTCSVAVCSRPAVESDGLCSEHRAGARAAGATMVVVEDGSGKGEHAYAPKRTEIYLAVFPDLGLIKLGKATPWTVRSRVKDAADKLRIRQAERAVKIPTSCEPFALSIQLFGDERVLWGSERAR
jgi:hypothetical protein